MNPRPFSQAVMWPSTILGASTPAEFEDFIAQDFNGARAKYIGCFLTKTDSSPEGNSLPGTGGRSDLVFAVHEDDLSMFAVKRLKFSMRWLDDVLANENASRANSIYVDEIHELKSWSQEDGSETGCVGE